MNGTISGDIYVIGSYGRSLNVKCEGRILTKDFEIWHSSPEIDRSKMEHCMAGMVVCEDIHFPVIPGLTGSCVKIKSNLRGKSKGVTLSFDKGYVSGISIQTDSTCVSDITIKKEIPNKWTNRYAIASGRSNIIIRNCVIYGSVEVASRSEKELSSNVTFENNTVVADFSAIKWLKNRFDIEKDAIVFKSVDNVLIKGNSFTFINVNRGFKLTANFYKENGQTVYFHYPGNIRIYNNTINAYTTGGEKSKQLIDCYIGAQNVDVANNQMNISDFTVLFENKTHAKTHSEMSSNSFRGNKIKCNCRISFIHTTEKDSFTFSDNDVIVSDPERPFTDGGSDYFNSNALFNCHYFSVLKILNNNVRYVGDKADLFFLVTSSGGRVASVTVNDNVLQSLSATIVSGVDEFTYSNNTVNDVRYQYEVGVANNNTINIKKKDFDRKKWPKYFINLQPGVNSGVLNVDLPKNIDEDYDVILNPSRVEQIDGNLNLEKRPNSLHVKRK